MTDATAPTPVGLSHPANVLTMTRVVFAPILFWLVLEADETRGSSWAAFVLGAAMAGTDFFDGWVARRANVVSRRGAFLDPLADKIVVLGVAGCLVAVERYWWVPVAIMAGREVGITVWRARWAREGLSVPARRSAKYKTSVQGLALSMAVFPPLETADTSIALLLWIAVGFTVYTGAQYVIDGHSGVSRTGR